MFGKKAHGANPKSTKDALQGYTKEEQLWILASAAAERQEAEAKMQARREIFYKYYGFWPDF